MNFIKRKVFLLSTGAAAIVAAGFAITVRALGAQPDSAVSQHDASQYVVRAESGKVTVFPNSSGLPEIETDIDTATLREYDRALLERGIEVEGYENMIGLLEDFSN